MHSLLIFILPTRYDTFIFSGGLGDFRIIIPSIPCIPLLFWVGNLETRELGHLRTNSEVL
jgi:hypothetical protein